MLGKWFVAGASGLLCLSLLGIAPASSGQSQEPPPPPKKKDVPGKEEPKKKKGELARRKADLGPEGDLNRAYDLLRRLRADSPSAGGVDPRLKEWTDHAADYYRNGLKALRDDNAQLAHEYAAIAHDLARAVDHARNAARYDRPDDDLPAPPRLPREGRDGEARKDLTRAYERLRDGDDGSDAGPRARAYRQAASDLYRAARRDFEAGRTGRASELARAAEAMSHVAEHLGHAADVRETPPPDADRKARERDKDDPRGLILPPPPEP